MDCSKVKGYNGSIKGKVLGSDAMWVTVPSRLAVLGHHPDCITTKFWCRSVKLKPEVRRKTQF